MAELTVRIDETNALLLTWALDLASFEMRSHRPALSREERVSSKEIIHRWKTMETLLRLAIDCEMPRVDLSEPAEVGT